LSRTHKHTVYTHTCRAFRFVRSLIADKLDWHTAKFSTPNPARQVSSLTIEQVDGGGSGPAKKRKGEDGEAYADEDDDDLGDIDEESLGSDDDDDEEEL
jgi:hypothetical protein